jgi:hypothetical protein
MSFVAGCWLLCIIMYTQNLCVIVYYCPDYKNVLYEIISMPCIKFLSRIMCVLKELCVYYWLVFDLLPIFLPCSIRLCGVW